jgi:hypothetical protein
MKTTESPMKQQAHNFGKGEVRSSILRGSTMFPGLLKHPRNLLLSSIVEPSLCGEGV